MTTRGAKFWSSGAVPLIEPDLLGDIISAAADMALVLDAAGTILSVLVNPTQKFRDNLDHWEKKNVRDYLTVESVPKLEAELDCVGDNGIGSRAVELNHVDNEDWEFPVRYTFHRISNDGTVLMLGRDLRPVAEMQQQLVRAQIALERDHENQRDYDTRYRVVMDRCRDPVVFVSISQGRMTDANDAAALVLGAPKEELTGAAFAQEFEGRRRGEFLESLTNVALDDSGRAVELVTKRTGSRVMVTPTVFRASGERLLHCRLDLAEQAEVADVDLAQDLRALFQNGADAIVFTDSTGQIRTANESFLNLADLPHMAKAKSKPISDFLSRGTVDMKVLLETATRAGQMRLYTTSLVSEFGNQSAVEISATYLADRNHPAFVFVIRNATRAETARQPGAAVGDEAMRSAMELVGTASLKDIVSETTDVIEKLCIETAVELTRNNRVAAAEMLGLSRQSLYVKLRKYGILER